VWDSEGLDKVVKPRKPGTIRTTRAKAGAKLKSEIPVTKAIEDAVVVEETVAVATGTLPDENSGAVTKAEPTQAAEAQALGDDTTHDIDAIQSKDAPGDEASAGPDTDAVRSEESVQEADAIEDAVAPTQAPTDAEIITPAASSTWEKAEPSSERAASTDLPQAVVPVPPPPAKGGFFPLLLGGIVAAILGAAALYYSNEQGWISLGSDDTLKASVDAQGVEIDALETALQSAQAEIEALRTAGAAIGTVNERVNGLSTVVDGLSEAAITLGGGLATTNKRLAEVATQPIPEARLPEKVTNAYEAKFAEFAKALQAEQDAKLAADPDKDQVHVSSRQQANKQPVAARRLNRQEAPAQAGRGLQLPNGHAHQHQPNTAEKDRHGRGPSHPVKHTEVPLKHGPSRNPSRCNYEQTRSRSRPAKSSGHRRQPAWPSPCPTQRWCASSWPQSAWHSRL